MKLLRVACFTYEDFNEGNGANSRLRAFATGLKEHGVMFALFLMASSAFNSNGINIKARGLCNGIYFNYLGGAVYHIPGFWKRNMRKVLTSWQAFFFLLKKGNKFDAIYLYQPNLLSFLPIYLYCIMSKIPVIVEKTENELSKYPVNWKEKLSLLFEQINQLLLPKVANHLVVISNKLKSHFAASFGENRITIIPIVVDTKRFAHIKMNGHVHHRIGYLGSLGEKDGVEGIINAFSKAKDTQGRLKLRLIGFNPKASYFERVLKHAGLNGEVEKTGQVTYDQIPDLLAECDLLVVNRTNQPYSHFGFPTKLAEYLATGIPTVATKVGDIEDYLVDKQDVILIDPDNSDALQEVIKSRYTSTLDYHTIGDNGRKAAHKHFSNKPHAQTLIDLINKLKLEVGTQP